MIGVAGPDVRLRLVRADKAGEPARPAGADPFVDVSGPDATIRAYLAELHLGDAVDRRPLIVMMEPNEKPQAYASAPLWTNRHVESAWSGGAGAMAAAAGPGMARLDAASGHGLLHHPPLAYCPASDAYAVPACPSCLGALTTCRDEDLLRAAGLPSFDSGADRFLHCAACFRDPNRAHVFYTHRKRAAGSPARGFEVRHRHELYSDLAPRIAVADPSFATHGCFVCRTLRASLPPDAKWTVPAHDGSSLFPLAYYDFDFVVREALPWGFEETASLLGGASVEELLAARAARRGLGLSADGRDLLARLGPGVSQFFFQGDPSGLFPLEALYLKLSAFTDLLDGVIRLYGAGRPHLALSPHRVRGGLRGRDTHLPARWGLSLVITDAITTAPLAAVGDRPFPTEPPLWLVPEPKADAYSAQRMGRAQSMHQQMRLDARSVDLHGGQDAARAHLVGTLASEVYTEAEHGRHDRVLVHVVAPASGQRIRFIGGKRESTRGGFVFEGVSDPLAPEDAVALRAPGALAAAAAEVTWIHQFGAPSDLLSLGLLYFRLLFWNDRQDAAALGRDVLHRVAGRAAGAARSGNSIGLLEWPELRAILAEEKIALEPSAVLHRAEDRESGGAIPAALWAEAFGLGLKMATFIEGWSFAGGLDDYAPADPAASLRRARDAVRSLAEQARASLIGSSGRNRFVQQVAEDFWADLEETKRGAASQTISPEATMVFDPRTGR